MRGQQARGVYERTRPAQPSPDRPVGRGMAGGVLGFSSAILLGCMWSWEVERPVVAEQSGYEGAKKSLSCREFGGRWPIVRRAFRGGVWIWFGCRFIFFRGASARRCGEPSQALTEDSGDELFRDWRGRFEFEVLRSASALTWLHAKRAMTSNRSAAIPDFATRPWRLLCEWTSLRSTWPAADLRSLSAPADQFFELPCPEKWPLAPNSHDSNWCSFRWVSYDTTCST